MHSSPRTLLLLTALVAAACGPADTGSLSGDGSLEVAPSQVELAPSGSTSFALTASISTAVTWSVLESGGGTVNSSGRYTAPSATGTFHVVATSVANPGVSGRATVSVTSTPPPPETSACAGTNPRSTGKVYYYCDCQSGAASGCVAGNDSNVGDTPSSPRRSFANAQDRFQSMNQGDTVALCRGGAWAESGGNVNNSRCSPSSPCDFRDYTPSWASSSTPRPRITTQPDRDMFEITTGGGYRLWNLDLVVASHSGETGETLVRIYGDAHDIDVCNVRFDNARTAFLVMNDQAPVTGVKLRDSQLYRSHFSSLYGGATGLLIDGNYFENSGQAGSNGDHTIYLIGTDGVISEDMKFVNNEVYSGRNGAICPGVQVVVHGLTRRMAIENNYIHTDSTDGNCFGISLSGGNAGGTFWNATIKRNRVFTRGAETIYVDGCIDCVVSDNVVSGGTFSFGRGGCESGSDVPCVQNLKVLNNTVYNASMSFGSRQSGTGYTSANNAVWNSGGGGYSTASMAVNTNNYVRPSGGPAATALFVNPGAGDFTPVAGSVIDGQGSETYYSPLAIGTATWSKDDDGATRTSPIDIGAFAR